MNTTRIAIPSDLPGGLEAGVSGHFGHCDLYTLVDVQDGRIAQVETLPSLPHEQGGCLRAVDHLARHGVTALIAGGMGYRPLMGFAQAGIQVYLGRDAAHVEAAVLALIRGDLRPFTRDQTCGGGHGH
jgi:predicted Fe-Mo cluster-binding NifX family protein